MAETIKHEGEEESHFTLTCFDCFEALFIIIIIVIVIPAPIPTIGRSPSSISDIVILRHTSDPVAAT